MRFAVIFFISIYSTIFAVFIILLFKHYKQFEGITTNAQSSLLKLLFVFGNMRLWVKFAALILVKYSAMYLFIPPKDVEFHANHPFLIAIVSRTDDVLFLGRLLNP
ncbi:serpin B4-like isoform X6 [Aphis craccivora]|uniref:Serpin B4-like isoform X6 n=1 Tax=Aphis craccivora TaxID=307492 RepID=A0A6G0ZRL1_APHCR|nr:serpin B4-like isoform X6 [Aphis craccivora]